MTKTYDDPATITLLLEEKEKDLELAARIGQRLLLENERMQEKIHNLEVLHSQDIDEISQLKHVMCIKDTLLQMYINNEDEEVTDDHHTTITHHTDTIDKLNNNQECYKLLQDRLHVLEGENHHLKEQAKNMNRVAESFEEQEDDLVNDCVDQLQDVTEYLNELQGELAKKNEDNEEMQGKLNNITQQMQALHDQAAKLLDENEVLREELHMKENSRRLLTEEISSWKFKLEECQEQLNETKNLLKQEHKTKQTSILRKHVEDVVSHKPANSLAHELQDCLGNYSFNSEPNLLGSSNELSFSQSTLYSDNDDISIINNQLNAYNIDDIEEDDNDDDFGSVTSSMFGGQEMSLSRATMPVMSSSQASLLRDSSHSSKHHFLSRPCSPHVHKNLHSKLKIVKRLEGSQTLQHWQSLATPHIGNLSVSRPGIKMRAVEDASSAQKLPRLRKDTAKSNLKQPHEKIFDNVGKTYIAIADDLNKPGANNFKLGTLTNEMNESTKPPVDSTGEATDISSFVPSWLQNFNFSSKVKEYLTRSLSLRKFTSPSREVEPTDALPGVDVGLNHIMYIKRNKRNTPIRLRRNNRHHFNRLLLEAISSKNHHNTFASFSSSSLTKSSENTPTISRSSSNFLPYPDTPDTTFKAHETLIDKCAGDSNHHPTKPTICSILHKSDLTVLDALKDDVVSTNKSAKPLPDILMN